jgi:hypothetical protein
MKYTIKGYEKKEVSFEVEADSYEEAYEKAIKKPNFKIENINDQIVSSSQEAEWADNNDIFNATIERVKCESELELSLLREVMKRNKGVKYFSIHFSGQGDDGNIDNVTTEPYTLDDVTEERIGPYKLCEILENIFMAFADDMPVDWVDGTGGSGQMNVKLNDKDEFEIDIECHSFEEVEAENFYKTVKFK